MRAEGNGHIKLKLGYIAVKNRSQQQVEDGISMEEARLHERQFFESNALVAGLDSSLWGMDTVIERIVDIQSQKVSEFIPKVILGGKGISEAFGFRRFVLRFLSDLCNVMLIHIDP